MNRLPPDPATSRRAAAGSRRLRIGARAILPIASLLFCAGSGRGAEWPQWRGPEGQGHSSATGLPSTWSETENVLWKTPIPGRGWSSPVIEGDRLWVTTAVEVAMTPEARERRAKSLPPGDQPLTLVEKVELRAVGLDLATGRVAQEALLLTEKEPQPVHQLNSYASPTPVLEDGRLYAHFGTFGTACLDTRTARVVWTNTDLHVQHENGPGSSPILWKDRLIFHLDGSDRQFVVALDKGTGKVAWKTDRSGELRENPQMRKSYATPLVVPVAGREMLLSQGADWLYGYEPATGRELWKTSYGVLGFSLAARPVFGHGMLYASIGFMKPEIFAYRFGSSGAPELAWRHSKGVPTMPSPLLVGDELYFVPDTGGVLTCLDARSGAERYRERLGGNHCSSPIFADGKIFIPNRDGLTTVVALGATFKKLGENRLDGGIFASPAAVGHALYLRTEKALYRIEEKSR